MWVGGHAKAFTCQNHDGYTPHRTYHPIGKAGHSDLSDPCFRAVSLSYFSASPSLNLSCCTLVGRMSNVCWVEPTAPVTDG